jgi:hypothetical protein
MSRPFLFLRRPQPISDSIVKQRTCVITPILSGAGYAVVPFLPLEKPRGWSAEWRTGSFRLAASSFEGCGRLSALHRSFSVPGTVASGRRPGRLLAHPIRQAFARLRPHRVQPTEGQSLIVETDGDPRPPGSEVTSLARGRRTGRQRSPAAGPLRLSRRISGASPQTWLHHRDVSRRRPQPSQARRRMKDQCGRNMDFIPICTHELAAAGRASPWIAGQARAPLRGAKTATASPWERSGHRRTCGRVLPGRE